MDSWEIMQLKRELFNLYDLARILFNQFYNGKDSYNKTDINAIYNLMRCIKKNIAEIEEEIKFEIEEEK